MADYRIHLYYTFSSMLSAGLPLLRVFKVAADQAPSRWKRIVKSLEQKISSGNELSEAMALYPRYFNKMDIRIVRVGEQTGQLAEIFKNLSEWYQSQSDLRRIISSGLAYPVFLVHMAAFTAPIPFAVLGGGAPSYARNALLILSLFYIPMFLFYLFRLIIPKSGPARRVFDEFLLLIPVIGRALKNLSLGRFCMAFSMMYKAGIPILKCAQDAPEICGNEAIAAKLRGGYVAAKSGNAMTEGFSKSLDSEFRELWMVGEESGNLDSATDKLALFYLDKAKFNFQMIGRIFPVIVYFIVAGFLGYLIIRGFQQIYGQIDTFIENI